MAAKKALPKKRTWNEIVQSFAGAHLLQTSQWADLKSRFGWHPSYLIWEEDQAGWKMQISQHPEIESGKPAAAGLLLERDGLLGLRIIYMPKGPLLTDWSNSGLSAKVLDDLAEYTRQRKALQLKIDPDLVLGTGIPGEEHFQQNTEGEEFQEILRQKGWVTSREQVQFRNTVLVDLQEDEDKILARMKSKTRYNIRLSGRKGIQVRLGDIDDLSVLYRMYAETSRRAGFTIRGESYYQNLWRLFMDDEPGDGNEPRAQPIIAEFEGKMVAAAVIFKFGDRSWYLHGMSSAEHNEKMAPHLVQWEAMRWAKEQGCTVYDMWGAPDQFDETDPLWGVYRFKRGYGGEVTLTIGAWDYPASSFRYAAYNHWLPRILDITRWFRNRRTSRVARSLE